MTYTVTLPRSVVEQALEAMESGITGTAYDRKTRALRAALEQPQDHSERRLDMVPADWKLVPVEPTNEMVQAWLDTYEGNIQTVYRAMLAAAPQPPVVEQPQVEQEPVAAQHRFRHPQKTMPDWSVWQPCRVSQRPAWEIDSQGYEVEYQALYTHPQNLSCKSNQARLATLWGYEKKQPPRQPLTDEEIFNAIRPLCNNDTNCHIIIGLSIDEYRAIERAHGIGGEA